MHKTFSRLLKLVTTAGLALTLGLGLTACGESAYEIAVKNGFEGTEQEWLESLKGQDGQKGDKGDKGDTGAAGAAGEKGDKGDTGAAGKDGKDGVDGKDGKDGATGAAGANGITPKITPEGYWKFGEETTDYKALGEDGVTPSINDEGYWCFGKTVTQYKAVGKNGKSAYEVYVEQYKEAHEGSEDGKLSLDDWLLSLRGTVWYTGDSEPDKAELQNVKEGDFYLRTFSDFAAYSGYEIWHYESTEKGVDWVKTVDLSKIASETDKKEYHIRDYNTLVEFRDSVNREKAHVTYAGAKVILDADITCKAGEKWTPIGADAQHLFKGTFEGGNHTITGLNVKGSGLFGYVGDGATIQNLTIAGATVDATTAAQGAAVVVGTANDGTVKLSKVSVTGTVNVNNGKSNVSVLVGSNSANVTLSECKIDVENSTITGTASVGALVGSNAGTLTVEKGATVNGLTVAVSQSTTSGGKVGALVGTYSGNVTLGNVSGSVKVTADAKISNKGLVGDGESATVSVTDNKLTVDWNGVQVTKDNYTLDSKADLEWLAKQVKTYGNTFAGEEFVLLVGEKLDLGEGVELPSSFAGNLTIKAAPVASEDSGAAAAAETPAPTNVLSGKLTVSTSGKVTAENVILEAAKGVVLDVTAAEGVTLTNCIVRRTTGDVAKGETLVKVTGNVTVNGSTLVSPVKGKVDELNASALEVSGELKMSKSTIATNGYGLNEKVATATLEDVTFCGLEGQYEGTDCEAKTLLTAIHSATVGTYSLNKCIVKDSSAAAIVAAGDSLTVTGSTFEASNVSDGIVFGYDGEHQINSAVVTGNTFNVAKGSYPVVFYGSSYANGIELTVKENTYGENTVDEVCFRATGAEGLKAALTYLTPANVTNVDESVVVSLSEDFELNESVTIQTALTLRGEKNPTISTKYEGRLIVVAAPSVTVEGINFSENNETRTSAPFAFINITNAADNFTAQKNTFAGLMQIKDAEEPALVTRAIEADYHVKNYHILDNEVQGLRQLAYLQGRPLEGAASDEPVGEVKGNTVTGAYEALIVLYNCNVTIEGNHLYNNTYSIKIIQDGAQDKNFYPIEKMIEISTKNGETRGNDPNTNTRVRNEFLGISVLPTTVQVDGENADEKVTKVTSYIFEALNLDDGSEAKTPINSLGNVLTYVNSEKDNADHPAYTIKLEAGEYAPTADEQFVVEASNVTLVGAGTDEAGAYLTTINTKTYSCSGQAGLLISGDNCTVEGLKVVTESTNANVAAVKVTLPAGGTESVKNVSFKSVEIDGNLGHALNLHGVDGATLDDVTIGKFGHCGLSLAKATSVLLTNVDFVQSSASETGMTWGAIGIMYKAEEGTSYDAPSDITIDFSTCTFGTRKIYSERPTTATGGVDKLYNGTSLEDRTEVNAENIPESWQYFRVNEDTDQTKWQLA